MFSFLALPTGESHVSSHQEALRTLKSRALEKRYGWHTDCSAHHHHRPVKQGSEAQHRRLGPDASDARVQHEASPLSGKCEVVMSQAPSPILAQYSILNSTWS